MDACDRCGRSERLDGPIMPTTLMLGTMTDVRERTVHLCPDCERYAVLAFGQLATQLGAAKEQDQAADQDED